MESPVDRRLSPHSQAADNPLAKSKETSVDFREQHDRLTGGDRPSSRRPPPSVTSSSQRRGRQQQRQQPRRGYLPAATVGRPGSSRCCCCCVPLILPVCGSQLFSHQIDPSPELSTSSLHRQPSSVSYLTALGPANSGQIS